MSAPWSSALRSVHGLHRRQHRDWRPCRADDCGAIPASVRAGRCLRHLPDHTARENALRAMVDRHQVVGGQRGVSMVDLRGTTFDEDLLDEMLKVLAEAGNTGTQWLTLDLQKCVFTGRADFTSRVFGHSDRPRDTHVDFSGARFDDVAVFTNARFHGPVFFEDTTFADTADFDQAVFDSDAWFLRTRFTAGVFHDATFAGLGRV